MSFQVFEKHPVVDAYRVGASFVPYAIVGVDKRLTDAELAAEYYQTSFLHENSLAENDGYDGMPDTREHRRQSLVLARFARLPHFDEPTA